MTTTPVKLVCAQSQVGHSGLAPFGARRACSRPPASATCARVTKRTREHVPATAVAGSSSISTPGRARRPTRRTASEAGDHHVCERTECEQEPNSADRVGSHPARAAGVVPAVGGGYRCGIRRSLRALFVVAALALVFAPGTLRDDRDPLPTDVVAAVLAPTADGEATVTASRLRELHSHAELAALLLSVVVAVAVAAGHKRRDEGRRITRDLSAERSPLSRRGPPVSVA